MSDLIEALRRAGWSVETQAPALIPGVVASRATPASYRDFVAAIRSCEAADGAVWFNGAEDFAETDGSGWDFLEQQISRAAAEGDVAWLGEVTRFWQDHLPIAISARGDYSHISLAADGRVVTGSAPDLEDVSTLADSFDAFVQRVLDEGEREAGELWELWIGPAD